LPAQLPYRCGRRLNHGDRAGATLKVPVAITAALDHWYIHMGKPPYLSSNNRGAWT
jgi:hypothetical protein